MQQQAIQHLVTTIYLGTFQTAQAGLDACGVVMAGPVGAAIQWGPDEGWEIETTAGVDNPIDAASMDAVQLAVQSPLNVLSNLYWVLPYSPMDCQTVALAFTVQG